MTDSQLSALLPVLYKSTYDWSFLRPHSQKLNIQTLIDRLVFFDVSKTMNLLNIWQIITLDDLRSKSDIGVTMIVEFLKKNPVELFFDVETEGVDITSCFVSLTVPIFEYKHIFMEFDTRLEPFFALVHPMDLVMATPIIFKLKYFCRLTISK